MKSKLYAAALAAVFAASATAGMLIHSAGSPGAGPQGWLAGSAPALADQGDNGKHKGKKGERTQNSGYYQNGVWYPNRNNNDNDNEDNQGNRANNDPHGCYNPAGHQRGWCKQHGYYGNGNSNQQVRGTVLSVNGNMVTLLQGLSTVRVNDQAALNNGRVSNLYPTRTVTAYGYWQGSTFFATSIG